MKRRQLRVKSVTTWGQLSNDSDRINVSTTSPNNAGQSHSTPNNHPGHLSRRLASFHVCVLSKTANHMKRTSQQCDNHGVYQGQPKRAVAPQQQRICAVKRPWTQRGSCGCPLPTLTWRKGPCLSLTVTSLLRWRQIIHDIGQSRTQSKLHKEHP